MKYIILILSVALPFLAAGQNNLDSEMPPATDSVAITTQDTVQSMTINGYIVTAMISEGDTIIIADLEEASITSLHDFGSKEEYRRYRKYRRYAAKVYPYAVEAIKVFQEMEASTEGMSKRQRKKHNKKLNKRLKKEFKDPLKKLSKTQGLILTKMIERHLDESMHRLIKNARGGFNAWYWHNLGKMNGYDLKKKYVAGEDHIMDVVLQDFDISREEVRSTDYLKSGILTDPDPDPEPEAEVDTHPVDNNLSHAQ